MPENADDTHTACGEHACTVYRKTWRCEVPMLPDELPASANESACSNASESEPKMSKKRDAFKTNCDSLF